MQGSRLYVGNLSYSVTQEQLQTLFEAHGEVKEVKVMEGKGFGFVEMSSQSEAEEAQKALNDSDFGGRTLKIDEARPRKSTPRRDYQRY